MYESLLLLLLLTSVIGIVAQDNPVGCPSILLTAPDRPVAPGQEWVYNLNLEGGKETRGLEFFWRSSNGRIVRGQGTKEISVVQKLGEDTVLTVTVEVKGLPAACENTRSESIAWDPAPITIVEDYSDLKWPAEKERLEGFAKDLKNHHSAMGAIVIDVKSFGEYKIALKRAKVIFSYLRSCDASLVENIRLAIAWQSMFPKIAAPDFLSCLRAHSTRHVHPNANGLKNGI